MHSYGYTVYTMQIIEKKGSFYLILIKSQNLACQIAFSPSLKEIEFVDDNSLTKELKENIYQLRKILHNKRKDTFYVGFKLKFIFKDNAKAIAFNDLSKLIVLDRREGQYLVKSIEKSIHPITQIFTDGCYLEKLKRGAYAVLFKKINGKLDLKAKKTNAKSSSLIELIAVIEGIKTVKNIDSLNYNLAINTT